MEEGSVTVWEGERTGNIPPTPPTVCRTVHKPPLPPVWRKASPLGCCPPLPSPAVGHKEGQRMPQELPGVGGEAKPL